jgi:hypothetical protein
MEITLGQMECRLKALARERDQTLRYLRELNLKTNARESTLLRWQHSADLVCADYTYLEGFIRSVKMELSKHEVVSGA